MTAQRKPKTADDSAPARKPRAPKPAAVVTVEAERPKPKAPSPPPPVVPPAIVAKVPEEQPGIRCRTCGCAHHWTIETTKTLNGKVRRRRECRHCGRRFTTIEREL